jgi:hypothetical protein
VGKSRLRSFCGLLSSVDLEPPAYFMRGLADPVVPAHLFERGPLRLQLRSQRLAIRLDLGLVSAQFEEQSILRPKLDSQSIRASLRFPEVRSQ